jgi:aspartate/methionine/tyrosine aminotransferase
LGQDQDSCDDEKTVKRRSLPVSRRGGVEPFIVMDVMRAAAERVKAGGDVVHMEVGEPGTAPPRLAREAVERALREGPIGYTQALGMPALRERIARHYVEAHGLEVDPARIIVTMGSSAGFILGFLAAFEAGDRLAVQTPGYPAYRNTTAALGIDPVVIETTAATRWAPTPRQVQEAHAEDPLAGLLVASPNNPTGTVIGREDLAALSQCCRELGLWFVSDEIYHGLTYGLHETTALAIDPDAIVINSFSKYWCMTGWRVGWMVVPERLVRPIERLSQNLFISAPYLSQVAALAAMDAVDELEGYKAAYARNRAILSEALPRLGFDEVLPMDGAFYAYVSVARFSNDSVEFSRRLLAETGIAATPGLDFDPARGSRYLRFSYAGTEEDMRQTVQRLENWLPR